MANNNGKMTEVSAILREVYKMSAGGEIHRNSVRNRLVTGGKFSSKGAFNRMLESLIALGKIEEDGDLIRLNQKQVQTGMLEKEDGEFYITVPNTKTHFPTSKAVAAAYKSGDVLDVVIEYVGKKPQAVILGKSQKTFSNNTKNSGSSKKNFAAKSNAQVNDNKIKTQAMYNNIFLSARPTIEKDNVLLGRVVDVGLDELVFIPNKKSLPTRHIPILNDKEEFSKFKNKICVMRLIDINAPALGGDIIEVKGEAGNTIAEYDAIAENYGAIMTWNTPELQAEISKIPTKVDVSKLKLITEEEAQISPAGKTVDLRHLPFSTIDPASCKDMDDAMYSTIDENGDYVTYTAVANISKYVDIDSAIGRNYIKGAFTIYAPNRAYGILPDELSTNICSLKPNEDRLAFVVKTVIDKTTGQAKESNIYDAVIKSRHKYSYEDAQEITNRLQETTTKDILKYKLELGETLSLDEQILMNHYAAEAIKAGFAQRKMLRFTNNNERTITFNDDMTDIVDIHPTPHLPYHEVVEFFMLTANEAAAKFAHDNNIDTIYRVHEEPNTRKVDRAKEFFSILGIDADDNLSAQSTNDLLKLVKGTPYEDVVNSFLIKMQSRAIYSDHLYSKSKQEMFDDPNAILISHYALQSPHYSHSTAGIRRSTDLAVHHNILAKIHGKKPIDKDTIMAIVDQANKRQLDVDQSEKDFSDISSVFYAEKHIGDTYSGRISKFRICAKEEGFNDSILVIARNEDTGISVEVPLSQILGNRARNCSLSEQGCAVLDEKGNVVLKLCVPIDFVIDKADRLTMSIVGKTTREMVRSAEQREEAKKKLYQNERGFIDTTKDKKTPYNAEKNKRKTRYEQNQSRKDHKDGKKTNRNEKRFSDYDKEFGDFE